VNKENIHLLCVTEARGKFEMNVSPSISLVYTALWATGVLNVEISEKRALDLKQRKIIILMTHHSDVHLCAPTSAP
jgi:hypothetical protein